MSHHRSQSEAYKQPHPISLKVLRLSPPSFSQQHALPAQSQSTNDFKIDARAALSSPVHASTTSPAAAGSGPQRDSQFILSPLLTLPPSFGSARVGQTFACTLCASNELPTAAAAERQLSGVRIVAEMQTPSQPSGVPLSVPLEVIGGHRDGGSGGGSDDNGDNHNNNDDDDEGRVLGAGQTLQRNVRFELREEGTHLLAVTVAYTETQLGGEGRAASGRSRSFRKIYQFTAQQLLSVRTKTQALPAKKGGRPQYSLEAQLENLGDAGVLLEAVVLHPKTGFRTVSLNWDAEGGGGTPPLLKPQDVYQVAFLLLETGQRDADKVEIEEDGRVVLGQLSIQWTAAMGDRGALSTGWLSYRKR